MECCTIRIISSATKQMRKCARMCHCVLTYTGRANKSDFRIRKDCSIFHSPPYTSRIFAASSSIPLVIRQKDPSYNASFSAFSRFFVFQNKRMCPVFLGCPANGRPQDTYQFIPIYTDCYRASGKYSAAGSL